MLPLSVSSVFCCGIPEIWRHGHADMETWRHGNMEMETWKHGDIDLRHGKMGKRRNGDGDIEETFCKNTE
jgi:hypothetical protein